VGGDGRVRTDGADTRQAGHQTGWTPTGGHRTGGHRRVDTDGWTPESWTLDGWTPAVRTAGPRTTTPGDRTPDGLDTGRAGLPDPGRRPRVGGQRMVDADRRPTPWPASWHCRPRRRRPPAGCRQDAPPGRRGLGEQQPGPLGSKNSEGTHAATDGPGHRRDRRLQVVRRRPAAPRRTAVLGSDGWRVERAESCHPLWRDVLRGVGVGWLQAGGSRSWTGDRCRG
jgi:hypothetical protein